MLRTIKYIIAVVLVLAVQGVRAQTGRGAELLSQVVAELNGLGCYKAAFEVVVDGESLGGEYIVEGRRYYLRMLEAEVYGDTSQRHEVDSSRREVTIVPVDANSATLIDNPASAFEVLKNSYSAEVQRETDSEVVVVLKPRAGNASERITATLRFAPLRPVELVYDYDGERVTIRILSIARVAAMPRFDAAKYEGYEMIDFR